MRSSLLAVALASLAAAPLRAQGPTVCFSGPIRSACSGFLIFEASAIASSAGVSTEIRTVVPVRSGPPPVLVNRVRDLPSYFSGGLGYLHVVNEKTAVGAVVELGYANTSDLGNSHRLAITGRARRQLGQFAADVGAGPLGVEVFVPTPNQSCCSERVHAYGATAEGAVLYRGWLGLTAGVDAIRGGGRSSFAVHGGARAGSYGAVATAIILGLASAVLFAGLSQSD